MCLHHFHTAGNSAVSSLIFQFFEFGFVILALNSAHEHSSLLCRTFYHVVDVLTPRESFATGSWERSVPSGAAEAQDRAWSVHSYLHLRPSARKLSLHTKCIVENFQRGELVAEKAVVGLFTPSKAVRQRVSFLWLLLRVFSLLLWGSFTFM